MSHRATVGNGMPFGLTRQELRILHLLCDGMSNKDIAAACGISIQTTKTHLGSVCQKIGASNRLEAAMFAVAKGLVALDVTGEYAQRSAIMEEIEACHRKIEKYVARSRTLVQQLAAPAQPE